MRVRTHLPVQHLWVEALARFCWREWGGGSAQDLAKTVKASEYHCLLILKLTEEVCICIIYYYYVVC